MKILILFIFLVSINTFGSSFKVSDVVVICAEKSNCKDITDVFKSLGRNYSDVNHFYSVFKLYVSNEGIKEMSFELEEVSKLHKLTIYVKRKPKILSVEDPIFIGRYEVELPTILPLKVDEYLDKEKIKETEKLLVDIARDKGFPNVQIKTDIDTKKEGVVVSFRISLKTPIVVKKILVNSNSNYLLKYLNKKIKYQVGQPFDIQKLKNEIEELRSLFNQFGYYLIDFNLRYSYIGKNSVQLIIDIKNPRRYAFYLDNDSFLSQDFLKKHLSENLISTKRDLTADNISSLISEKLEGLGFKFSKTTVMVKEGKDNNNDVMTRYLITVKDGPRSMQDNINFKGNSFFTHKELISFFKENAFDQASEEIYDERYYKKFIGLLREKYISAGFVSVFIDSPVIQFAVKTKKVNIIFRVREGVRTNVSRIRINGIPENLKQSLLEKISIREAQPFNPILFKDDLGLISDYLKNQGYYFSKIANLNSNSLVKYISDNSQVNIQIDLEMGSKIYADDIIIIGNQKTRKILIKRELEFKSGSLITSERLEKSQNNLLALGIFSSVQIKPVTQGLKKTDILIFVREKDFGLVEFAPGVRSDIGFKVSSAISYNNIDGMNKRVSFQGTINRRFDLSSLDDTRRRTSQSLIEYDASVNYSENHIFHSDYDFGFSLTNARKRLFSYDVDIERVSYTVSRKFTNWLEVSFRQQLEIISGFNATDETNHGHFQIGSFTPAVNFDFRDRAINPTKGANFDLSLEIANPFFLSQSNSELEIDYYKFINRNRFYIPINDRTVFAISTSFGIQQNNTDAADGYIPNIKVFRLSGADIVRGYEDEEINTLVSGKDISDVRVDSKAYMANLKFEPRYYLSDSTILGVFYDAGRVFVDELSAQDLRSSVGLSFKFVTPVGTLDIDYGIKTLRKEDSSGSLESPGRLHVSIGFF